MIQNQHQTCYWYPDSIILRDLIGTTHSVCAVRHDSCLSPDIFVFSTLHPGSVRLQGGRSKLDGRVEVYLGGAWGSVCSDGWGGGDAAVACRQLARGSESTHAYTYVFILTLTLLLSAHIHRHMCYYHLQHEVFLRDLTRVSVMELWWQF